MTRSHILKGLWIAAWLAFIQLHIDYADARISSVRGQLPSISSAHPALEPARSVDHRFSR